MWNILTAIHNWMIYTKKSNCNKVFRFYLLQVVSGPEYWKIEAKTVNISYYKFSYIQLMLIFTLKCK